MAYQPIKRHEALHPLSRHHHHGLVIATRLEQISVDDSEEWIRLMQEDLEHFWLNGGNGHFREEEEILLPTFAKYGDVEQPIIIEALLDHVRIRSLIQSVLASKPVDVEQMNRLGSMLRQHIKKEESVVFQLIEQTVPVDDLVVMGSHFSEVILKDRTSYVRRKE